MSGDTALALYGGTFDPIHYGHLLLARDAAEHLGLDRVIFIPARISPHKLAHPPAPPAARLEMLQAAVTGFDPRFAVDERELRREGPSFTIDTLREYRREHPQAALHFLLGEDNLAELHTWKDSEALKNVAQLVVLARSCSPPPSPYPRIGRVVEITSTEIRARVARGLPIVGMVPAEVAEVIARWGLYRHG